jgi:RNA polymerase sigma-70 factor (ECF subfamily)
MMTRKRDDAELVLGARRGEAPAREELARRYLRRAFGVALAVLQNVADAEDVAQEAISAAVERLHECRLPERFGGWLLRGVRNRALNERARRVYRSALLLGLATDERVEADEGLPSLGKALRAALDQLPPVRRSVMLLHDLEEWTHGEIADALQISVEMSRQHLFVARKAMRAILGPDAFLGAPAPG